jgi:anti-sigma B factor antagonist
VDLRITIDAAGTKRVVCLDGTCDLSTIPKLREALQPLVPPEVTEIVVDVSDLDSLASTGLGVVLGALRRQRESGGDLRIVGAHGPVRKLFETIGLGKIVRLD